MSDEPLVSVIVPAYNCEQYIEKCIKSIEDQDYSNLEIIIVNDGSTDTTVQKIKSIIEKDTRIIYLSQNNQGVSHARNAGLDVARGKYICFVDADDQIGDRYIEQLVNNIENCDMVTFYLHSEQNKNSVIVMNDSKLMNELILNNNIGGYPWNKIYKREIINKFNIRFDENIHVCEDLLFNVEYLQHINNAVIIKSYTDPLYYYNIRQGSALRKKDERIIEGTLSAYEKILFNYRELLSEKSINKLEQDYTNTALRCILFHTYRLKKIDKQYVRQYLHLSSKYKRTRRQQLIYLNIKFFPDLFLNAYLLKHKN